MSIASKKERRKKDKIQVIVQLVRSHGSKGIRGLLSRVENWGTVDKEFDEMRFKFLIACRYSAAATKPPSGLCVGLGLFLPGLSCPGIKKTF